MIEMGKTVQDIFIPEFLVKGERGFWLFLIIGLMIMGLIGLDKSAEAASTINVEGNIFYTDDADLFFRHGGYRFWKIPHNQ